MKPKWEDAPHDAQWLAMDADGTWHFFETEPVKFINNWVVNGTVVVKKRPQPWWMPDDMVKEPRPSSGAD